MSDSVHATEVVADLTVRVPRDRGGDLQAGVRAALRRADAIETVEAVTVTGVTPRLNAISTDVTARLTLPLARPTAGRAATALESGFGIETNAVRLPGLALGESSATEPP